MSKRNVLCAAFLFMESCIFFALAGLEYLSGYRAGVMRHLYFAKVEYNALLYSDYAPVYHLGVFIVGYAYVHRKTAAWSSLRKIFSRKYYLALFALFVLTFALPAIQELYIAAHLRMALEGIALLELLRITLKSLPTTKKLT